ncbi:MAG: hypothetical protein KDA79_16085, partial [Planctomycetaceae bacterium]|nr:hypothetical protein [Planctomycetaceae bacterium]
MSVRVCAVAVLSVAVTVLVFSPVVSLPSAGSSAAAAERAETAPAASPLDGLVDLLRNSEDPAVRRDILLGMQAALEGRRSLRMPDQWPKVAAHLQEGADIELRELVDSLSVTFGNPAALKRFEQVTRDRQAEPAARQRALAALLQRREQSTFSLLLELLDDEAVQAAVIRGLAAYEQATIPTELLKRYPQLPPAVRQDVIGTLSSR